MSARQAQPGGALSGDGAARQGAAELQARLLSAAYASSGGAAYASAGGAAYASAGGAPSRAPPAVHVHADARGGGGGAAAHALADLLGPCAPLSIGAAGPGGALGPLQGPFPGLLAGGGGAGALRGLHAPGRGPGGHRASVLGRRKRSDADEDGGDGPVVDLTEDTGMHADSPRGHFAAPAARGTPGRTLFTPMDPGFHPHPGHAAAGRTPPGAEGGLCARRRTSSDSPVLSIDLMRFGGGAPVSGDGGGNPALSAGGYAAFHGPHEADTRGAVRQALSRHLSGHASGHSQPEASAAAPEDDADEEATVRGGVFFYLFKFFPCLPASWLPVHLTGGRLEASAPCQTKGA